MTATQYVIEGLRLDPDRRRLAHEISDEPVPLSPKALETLVYLVEHRGTLIEKSVLMTAIWPTTVVEDNSLDRNISAIRRVFGERPGENRLIVTVPGRGYRFVAPVREVVQPAVPAPQPAPPPALLAGPLPAPRVRPIAAALLLLGLAIAASTFAVLQQRKAQSAPVVATRALAVLPFRNLTGEASSDYLAEGFAEALLQQLATNPGLRVAARSSSFSFRGRDVDVREVGAALDVTHVLEGALGGTADRMQLRVQLVDARTGYNVWTQTYERPLGDALLLQEELARAVQQSLLPGLHAGAVSSGNAGPGTRNSLAWRLYLQANALSGASRNNIERALSLYDEAIALDPQFARAWIARGSTRVAARQFGYAPPASLVVAERDLRHALELQPAMVEAHAGLLALHTVRGEWLAAEAAFQRVQTALPDDPVVLVMRAMMLGLVGHGHDALQSAERAVQLAPLALPPLMSRSTSYFLVGRQREAMQDLKAGLALGAPATSGAAPLILSMDAALAGRMEEAGRLTAATLPPQLREAGAERAVAMAYAALTDPDARPAAALALQEFTRRAGRQAIGSRGVLMVTLHTWAGDLDSAFAAAEAAIDDADQAEQPQVWSFALWADSTSALRRDARFAALVKRLPFEEYWRLHGAPDGCVLESSGLRCAR